MLQPMDPEPVDSASSPLLQASIDQNITHAQTTSCEKEPQLQAKIGCKSVKVQTAAVWCEDAQIEGIKPITRSTGRSRFFFPVHIFM